MYQVKGNDITIVADNMLSVVLKGKSTIRFLVTNYYLRNSVKSMDKEKRSGIGEIRIKTLRCSLNKPKQFDKEL